MTPQERPFLDFYGRHSIIPTELVIPDEKMFFKQRDFLFQSLGIPPQLLRGKTIFELGPGNGQKLKHLLSLGPASYTAVDANPSSLEATNRVIQASGFRGPTAAFDCDILEYSSDETYDLVLAELVVPTQIDPSLVLEKLRKLVNDGGLLILTCMDPVSLLSELIRKAIVIEMELITVDINESAKKIATFFAPDLKFLVGMNRKPTDWALDQIIKPSVGKLFSIPEALDALNFKMEFHGSSPKFFQDFRWYKNPVTKDRSSIDLVKSSYWQSLHLLLDFRLEPKLGDPSLNQMINAICEEIFLLMNQNRLSDFDKLTISAATRKLEILLSDVSPITANSIESFLLFWDSGNTKKLAGFRPWWGRGTQYLSFIKDRI